MDVLHLDVCSPSVYSPGVRELFSATVQPPPAPRRKLLFRREGGRAKQELRALVAANLEAVLATIDGGGSLCSQLTERSLPPEHPVTLAKKVG